MNREVLRLLLRQAHADSSVEQRRVVARAAGDLADSGRFAEDRGVALTPQDVVEGLADAPEEMGVVERWNWWVGSLELAHGGYDRFRVRQWRTDE